MFISDISEYDIISAVDVDIENSELRFWDNNNLMA